MTTYVVAQWERIVAEAADAGVPEIRLSGGEPLVLPQIDAMCAAVTRRKLRYTLTTNGSRLERHLSWLRDASPETLWISFHREYQTVSSFLDLIAPAIRELPRVGLNVFAADWDDAFATAGFHRIKLLTQSPVGRAQASGSGEPALPQAIEGVELRFESTTHRRGAVSCVLHDRPLASVDEDGRVYACCVTVGAARALIGDLACEPLSSVLRRSLEARDGLPCADSIPAIRDGREGCPVALYSAL